MAPVLFVIGAVLVITGAALLLPEAGLIAAGVLALFAGWDTSR